MSAGADSIHPLAVDFTPEVEAAARAVAKLRESLLPQAPETWRREQPRGVAAPEAVTAEVGTKALAAAAPLFTAVAFRPDGRRALAIEVTLLRCLALGVGSLATLAGAIALGWAIGEWTARL
jgi:hypothetical protein